MAVTSSVLSGLSHINLNSNDPVDLFTDWMSEARHFSSGPTNIGCLSTISLKQPRSRHVLLRRYDDTEFAFITDNRSRKSSEIAENSVASICIYWIYHNDKNEHIWRQVRIEGIVETVPRDEVEKMYNSDPLYCKIRAYLCHQDSVVNWDNMKKRHDELLEKAKTDRTSLPMPDHVVGYKIVPTWMEFYYTQDRYIADRLEFDKTKEGTWKHQRLAA